MSELRYLHLRGALGKSRMEMYEGREHLVVPVVALMEGVIHAVNAEKPEFVPLTTLQKAAASWNGKPVVLGHPVKNGRQCTANSPDVLESHGIGTIFNSRVEGTKLLQEAWIDKAKAERLHPKMLARLMENLSEEVSVGAHVSTRDVTGTHGGRSYLASWEETTGDHLAFLPGGRGACSIEMGCGAHRAASFRMLEASMEEEIDAVAPTIADVAAALRVAYGKRNSDTDQSMIQAVHDHAMALGAKCDTQNVRFMAKYKDCPTCGGSGNKDGNPCEACDGKGEMKVAAALPPGSEKVTDGAADCKKCGGTGKVFGKECDVCGGTGKMKAVKAAEKSAEEIDRELVERAAAGNAAFRAACGCGGTRMTPEAKAEIIKQLVADKHSGFTAGDEKMLESASDERLESFRVAAASRASTEKELRAAADKKLTAEEFMAVAPTELKALIARQQTQETNEKAALITALKVAQSEYSEAELSVMDVGNLQRMARVANVAMQKVDYSGRAIPRTLAGAEENTYEPPDPYDAGLKALQGKTVN